MDEKDIPNLIVGHVGSEQARIWVRGPSRAPVAFLKCRTEAGDELAIEPMLLQERHAYTGVFEVQGLTPATAYVCEVSFAQAFDDPSAKRIAPRYNTGYFRSAPPEGAETELRFIFGSCNLHSLGIVSSPDPAYRRITELVREKGADLMLHCGDQIYYDMPIPDTTPNIDQYRNKYLDAWGDCEPAAQLLTMLPNYMILDDHEIFDDFSNDKEILWGSIEYIKMVSLKAYREFQHIHNPQSYGPAPLYYNFSYGKYRFFVMDVRSERFRNPPGSQMIGEPQLAHFFEWLQQYPNDIKFVVSSGPFVGEVRNSSDKWSSPAFRPQREQIIEFIAGQRIPNIIFLTGDRHNAYYASMKIAIPGGEDLVIHELMSSPINQLSKRGLNHYFPSLRSTTPNGISYLSEIDVASYYGTHSNVMAVEASGNTVRYEVYRTKKTKPARRSGSFVVRGVEEQGSGGAGGQGSGV